MPSHTETLLSAAQIEDFIANGFVRIDNAFPRELADAGRAILWADTGCDPDNPATWTRPVIRLGFYTQPPFAGAVNSPRLRAAYDQLVGAGRWAPQGGLGTFPVRFPSTDAPGDDGWHVDASLPGDDPGNFFSCRTNVRSDGRALLMLFLFSDVGPDDAPTRIRVGSHLDVARALEPHGDRGLDVMELVATFGPTELRPEALAVGEAGTVYLCHPFLVHAAQPHRGSRPRFMAQPPLLPRGRLDIGGENGPASPVEAAIRRALGRG